MHSSLALLQLQYTTQFFFFCQNTSCIRKPQVISGGGGGLRTPCTLPLDPPLKLKSGSCHAPEADTDLQIRRGGRGGEFGLKIGGAAPRPLPWIRHWLRLSINVRSVKDELFRRPAVGNQNRIRLLGASQVFPILTF